MNLPALKSFARTLASRRRRPDLVEDIESAASLYLLEHELDAIPADLDRIVAKLLDLADNFSTARDGDLTAKVNESRDHGYMASFLEEKVVDPHGEEELLSAIDHEPRIEGRDQAEILGEIDELAAHELTLEEDQILSLRFQYGYTWREIGRYVGQSQTSVSLKLKKYRERKRQEAELADLKARMERDDEFTKLEVSWIRI